MQFDTVALLRRFVLWNAASGQLLSLLPPTPPARPAHPQMSGTMQMPTILLRIIFVLSTIVIVTDCCSSRILFLREETFNIIQQQKMDQYQQMNNGDDQPLNEKYEQHIKAAGTLEKTFNKTVLSSQANDSTASEEQTNNDAASLEGAYRGNTPAPNKTTYTEVTQDPQSAEAAMDTTPSRDQLGDNKRYHVIDIYYTIMKDVLSFSCTGKFDTEFCLNGGRCFRYPVGNHSFFSCECADGYVGERCESKSVNGVFVPTASSEAKPPRILTARVVFSYPMLILLTLIYLFLGMTIVFKCQPAFKYRHTPSASRAAGLLFT